MMRRKPIGIAWEYIFSYATLFLYTLVLTLRCGAYLILYFSYMIHHFVYWGSCFCLSMSGRDRSLKAGISRKPMYPLLLVALMPIPVLFCVSVIVCDDAEQHHAPVPQL
jgi:hypothetical protein